MLLMRLKTLDTRKGMIKLHTVRPSICHTPICPKNPINPKFFARENLTNRELIVFQKNFKINLL